MAKANGESDTVEIFGEFSFNIPDMICYRFTFFCIRAATKPREWAL